MRAILPLALSVCAAMSANDATFSVKLSRAAYRPGETMTVTLTLRAPENTPVTLEFNSSQEYDIVIEGAGGKEVYRWSAGRMFAQALHDLTVPTGKKWTVPVTLPREMARGRYAVRGILTVMGERGKYEGMAGFSVR
jgi:uncharacterized protein (DUF58 family)